jgi:hypothetical protein
MIFYSIAAAVQPRVNPIAAAIQTLINSITSEIQPVRPLGATLRSRFVG